MPSPTLLNQSQVFNKHRQKVFLFSRYPGNTELEKCTNFLNDLKAKFTRFDAVTKTGDKIVCLVTMDTKKKGYIEVFNDLEEKIGEKTFKDVKPKTINDIQYDLSDIGFEI